jgi:hypothetical protein
VLNSVVAHQPNRICTDARTAQRRSKRNWFILPYCCCSFLHFQVSSQLAYTTFLPRLVCGSGRNKLQPIWARRWPHFFRNRQRKCAKTWFSCIIVCGTMGQLLFFSKRGKRVWPLNRNDAWNGQCQRKLQEMRKTKLYLARRVLRGNINPDLTMQMPKIWTVGSISFCESMPPLSKI